MACVVGPGVISNSRTLAVVLVLLKCSYFRVLKALPFIIIFINLQFTPFVQIFSSLSYHSFYPSKTAVRAVESSYFFDHFSQRSFLNFNSVLS